MYLNFAILTFWLDRSLVRRAEYYARGLFRRHRSTISHRATSGRLCRQPLSQNSSIRHSATAPGLPDDEATRASIRCTVAPREPPISHLAEPVFAPRLHFGPP